MPDEAPAGRSAPTLLGLMWLASPALPVGGYSYSEGLEAAVEARLVTTEDEAARWLLDQFELALVRAELPLLLLALDAWHRDDHRERIVRLNDWARRSRESFESRRQSEQTGRSLAEWLRHGGTDCDPTTTMTTTIEAAAGSPAAIVVPAASPGSAPRGADSRVAFLAALAPAPAWPVAFALAAARAGAGPRDAALACAFGWAANMVQAAMKTVPLGQTAGQRLLGRLAAALPQAVEAAIERAACAATAADDGDGNENGPGDAAMPTMSTLTAAPGLQAYAPGWAILSSQHESQYSRLFRS